MSRQASGRGRCFAIAIGAGAVVGIALAVAVSVRYPLFVFVFWWLAALIGAAIGLTSFLAILLAIRLTGGLSRRSQEISVLSIAGLVTASVSATASTLLKLDPHVPTLVVGLIGGAAAVGGALLYLRRMPRRRPPTGRGET